MGKTEDVEDHSAASSDVESWSEGEENGSSKWRPASFTFHDHDSSEGSSRAQPNLSIPPNFLNNNDRLSSLGSVEGTGTEDLINAN